MTVGAGKESDASAFDDRRPENLRPDLGQWEMRTSKNRVSASPADFMASARKGSHIVHLSSINGDPRKRCSSAHTFVEQVRGSMRCKEV
jgi:hypothetical protein